MTQQSSPAEGQPPNRAGPLWLALALVVFSAALVARFHPVLGRDLSHFAASQVNLGDPAPLPDALKLADHRFVAWLVTRNAYTLLQRPWQMFDSERCFPAKNTLAMGDPVIALGVLGAPVWLLSRDPILTLNLATLALYAIAALAMFWLVRDWTGVPAAGIVAGLLYSFHALKAYDVVHPFAYDGAWTVLALFFARRLLETERWRDALALSAVCGFQISQSFYPLLAAGLVGVPFATWLLFHHGLAGRRPLQLGVVAGAVAFAAWVFLSPYLATRSEEVIAQPGFQVFLPWSWIVPGGRWSIGLLVPALALSALFLPPRRALRVSGDPRWLLLVVGLVALYVAAGGNDGEIHLAKLEDRPAPPALPNPYLGLARWIPGLEVIRGPFTLATAAWIAFCILAGLGAAALIRSVPRRAALLVSLVLIAAAYVDVIRPLTLGLEPRVVYEAVELRPRSEGLELHGELLRSGNTGPLVELPLDELSFELQAENLLLSAYHHRRTASCYGSFVPPESRQVQQLAARMPEQDAARQLRELGFTTLIVWHDGGALSKARRRRFEQVDPESYLKRLGGNDVLSAWLLVGSEE